MIKKIKKYLFRYQLCLKAGFLILFFIFSSTLIAVQTGITDEISKIFYWPVKSDIGQVAGEYTVKAALNFSATAKRGLVALPAGSGRIYLGWRMLSNDTQATQYNLYRKSEIDPQYTRIATVTNSTNYVDESLVVGETYFYYIKPVTNGIEGEQSNEVNLEAQSVVQNYLRFRTNGFNRVIVGDLNGDGFFEYIVQEPRILNNDSTCDATMIGGVVDEDCIWDTAHLPNGQHYKLTAYSNQGEFLWTFDTGLGQNGDFIWNHSANYNAYDINQDGRDEIITFIMENGNYKLAILNGQNGSIISKSTVFNTKWTNDSINEYARMYLGVALLDGSTPSIIMQAGRGRSQCGDEYDAWIVAFNSNLQQLWEITAGDCISGHGFNIGDFDGDGKDEILMGDNMIDDNGTLKWSRNSGHVDLMIPAEIDPNNNGLEIFFGWEAGGETNRAGAKMELVSANTGNVLWEKTNKYEIHEGGVGNFTSAVGLEIYANEMHNGDRTSYLITATGQELVDKPSRWSGMETYPIRWDDDDLSELLDTSDESSIMILKYNGTNRLQIAKNFNETYSNKWTEGLAVDLFGDWREEVIGQDSQGNLYVYTNTNLSAQKKNTFLQDRLYKSGMSTMSQGYFRYLNTSGKIVSTTPITACQCSSWVNQSCGSAGGCSSNNTMGQSRTCVPANCDITTQCIVDSSCTTSGDNSDIGGSTTNDDLDLLKIDSDSRNPAVDVDAQGNLHISYDCGSFVHAKGVFSDKLCYAKVTNRNGLPFINKLFPVASPLAIKKNADAFGLDSRLRIDQLGNTHIVYNEGYIVLGVDGSMLAKNENLFPVTDHGLVFARLDIDSRGNAYVLYQYGDKETAGSFKTGYQQRSIRLKKIKYENGIITEVWDRAIAESCNQADAKRMTPGNIKINSNDVAYLSWRDHNEGGGCGEDQENQGIWYTKFDTRQATPNFATKNKVLGVMSDFSDLEIDSENNIHFVATKAWGYGLAYTYINNSGLSQPASTLFAPPQSQVIYAASERFGEANTICPALKNDTLGKMYLSFAGAGTQEMPSSEFEYYVAYYSIIDKNTLVTGNNLPNLFRFTPLDATRTRESDQGTQESNPIIGKAWNQGVFMVFEDNYYNTNNLFDIYLKGAGGAVIGIPKIKADFNCDGKINIQDFGILLSYWGKTEPPDNILHYTNASCKDQEKNLNLDNIFSGSDHKAVITESDFGVFLPCWGTPKIKEQAVCFIND